MLRLKIAKNTLDYIDSIFKKNLAIFGKTIEFFVSKMMQSLEKLWKKESRTCSPLGWLASLEKFIRARTDSYLKPRTQLREKSFTNFHRVKKISSPTFHFTRSCVLGLRPCWKLTTTLQTQNDLKALNIMNTNWILFECVKICHTG